MLYQNGALPKYQCWTKSRSQNRQLDFPWSGQIQRGCGQQTRRLGGGRIGQSRYVFDKGFTVNIYPLHIETGWRGVGEIPIENYDVTIGKFWPARHVRGLSTESSLSCHNCCDTGARFFRYHPKDCPILIRFLT